MFKKKKIEQPVELAEIPKAFKDKYGKSEEEEIVQAVEGEEDSEAEEEIKSIQNKINQLKKKQVAPKEEIEAEWELIQVPARTVAKNKKTGQLIEITQENFMELLNGS